MYVLNGMKNLICAPKGALFQSGQAKPYGALALRLIDPKSNRQFEAVIVVPDEHIDAVSACVAELCQRMKLLQKDDVKVELSLVESPVQDDEEKK